MRSALLAAPLFYSKLSYCEAQRERKAWTSGAAKQWFHGFVPINALWLPVQGIGREATRSKHVKSDVEWYDRLAKHEFNPGFGTGGHRREFCLLLVHGNVTLAVEDPAQSVSAECVHGVSSRVLMRRRKAFRWFSTNNDAIGLDSRRKTSYEGFGRP